MENSKLTLPDWLIHSNFEKHFIALSGGVDSMVLLHLMKASNIVFEVLHVNYHLRGEASNLDQDLIEKYCLENKLKFHVLDADPTAFNQPGVNLQNEARKTRYDWFETYTLNTFPLLLAHHQDDQIETFYMNLHRKSGIMGLSCMLEKDDLKWRPLLHYSKEEIYNYAIDHSIKWREDQSNASLKYQRNIWRNVLIPSLMAHQKDLKNAILLLIETFQTQRLIIEKKISKLLNQIQQEQQLTFEQFSDLNDDELICLAHFLKMSSGQIIEWKKLLTSSNGAQMILNNCEFDSITKENEHFYFSKENIGTVPSWIEEMVDVIPTSFDAHTLYLDKNKLKGSLKCRLWQKGDRLYPIGLNGSKLVSDILKDAKIPHHQKKQQWVMYDDEHLICCVGVKIDRRKIATQDTKRILKVRFSSKNDLH